MKASHNDSLDLFADTLTITLGCVIFIVLLLVIITQSHQLDEGGLFHLQRRSEILTRQIELAEEELAGKRLALAGKLASDPAVAERLAQHEVSLHQQIGEFLKSGDTAFTRALLAENMRSNRFIAQAPWIAKAVADNTASLQARSERAFQNAAENPVALSILREGETFTASPVYWIIKDGRSYPVAGGPDSPHEHVRWAIAAATASGEQQWEIELLPGKGLSPESGIRILDTLAEKIRKPTRFQLVMLVYADSFAEGRTMLAHASTKDIHFSWRPMQSGQRILMSRSGIPPETPF